MFRIRIYYYADPDSGSYFSQLGSGSGVGGTLKEEYILKKVELNNFLKILLCFLGIIFIFPGSCFRSGSGRPFLILIRNTGESLIC